MKKSLRILVSLLVAAAAITPLAALSLVFADSSDVEEREAEAELEDPGNYAFGPSGVTGEIEFEDDGTTLTITGEAEGLIPGVPYASLIYDIASPAEGPFACEPGIFDPSDPNFIITTMFIGLWDVDEDGEGELSAINIVDDTTGERVYVPLELIGTVSIRDFTVPNPGPPFFDGSGPAAVVACGVVEAEDFEEEEDEEDEEGEARFESKGMRGVTTDLLGQDGTIRSVPGAGLPWIIDEGEVKIEDGRLQVKVKGLVFDPALGSPLGGTVGPFSQFGVIVSCITVISGSVEIENTPVMLFDIDEDGDGELEIEISLPDPCFGIIVFVTSPGGSWFAVTGF